MAIEIPFKPYLIRAFYEWTVDNGQTPYIVAKPGAYARVPRQYVKDEHIVLDIGPEATAGLHMDNEGISFKARLYFSFLQKSEEQSNCPVPLFGLLSLNHADYSS